MTKFRKKKEFCESLFKSGLLTFAFVYTRNKHLATFEKFSALKHFLECLI